MTEPSAPDASAEHAHPEDVGIRGYGEAVRVGSDIFRRVPVKGGDGAKATMVIVVRQNKVSVSISPFFTWEAIMEPGKVDEVIRTLAQARDDARRTSRKGTRGAPRS